MKSSLVCLLIFITLIITNFAKKSSSSKIGKIDEDGRVMGARGNGVDDGSVNDFLERWNVAQNKGPE